MIDAHTHILPAMDDGSPDVATSLRMLRMLQGQGADAVLATPHFYAERERPSAFLERRARSFGELCSQLAGASLPKPRLGAEVRWYSGMGKTEELEGLRIAGTRLILVEMPFTDWNKNMVAELHELQDRDFLPVLAHVDRYGCFSRKDDLTELNENGFYLQVNAEALGTLLGPWRVAWMMRKGLFQFWGSDCHNMGDRKPDLDLVTRKLTRLCSEEVLDNFEIISESLIGGE